MNFSDSKAREFLENLNSLHIADRPEYARAIPDIDALETSLLESGCPASEVEDLIQELAYYMANEEPGPALRLMAILSASVQPPAETSVMYDAEAVQEQHKPRFRTSVEAINMLTRGGYGLTTIGGNAKAGKTMFAVGTAIEAALDGWRVVYVNGELDRVEMLMAIMRRCNREIPEVLTDRLKIVEPRPGFSPGHAIRRIQQAVIPSDDRVLIVLDSINALVDLSSEDGGDYWAASSVWRNWAVRAVRESLGSIAFLVVSETNQHGAIKGRQLEYKSDLVIRIHSDEDDSDKVSIDVTHSRSTKSGSLGDYVRDWQKGRFEICA